MVYGKVPRAGMRREGRRGRGQADEIARCLRFPSLVDAAPKMVYAIDHFGGVLGPFSIDMRPKRGRRKVDERLRFLRPVRVAYFAYFRFEWRKY